MHECSDFSFYIVKNCLGFFTFIKVAGSAANFVRMKKSLEKIHELRSKAELSLNKTAQLQQALAQLEATLSRKENQKVTEKSKKKQLIVVSRSFKLITLIYVF